MAPAKTCRHNQTIATGRTEAFCDDCANAFCNEHAPLYPGSATHFYRPGDSMRYAFISPILFAAVVLGGCDAGTPTEAVKAPRAITPSAFLTEAQILKLTRTIQWGGTTIRMYAENFHEVGQPCNEQVT